MTDDIVKPYILEANLLYCFLELIITENFECIPINKQHWVSFNLSMATLDQAFASWLFSTLITIKSFCFKSFQFVSPFLTDNFEKSFRRYVICHIQVILILLISSFFRRNLCACHGKRSSFSISCFSLVFVFFSLCFPIFHVLTIIKNFPTGVIFLRSRCFKFGQEVMQNSK